MTHAIDDTLRGVRDAFLAEARKRYPEEQNGFSLSRRLIELTGISCLDSPSRIVATFRGGSIAVVTNEFPLSESTDKFIRDRIQLHVSDAEALRRDVLLAAAWLNESPQRRVLVSYDDQPYMTTVVLNVYLDVRQQRRARQPSSLSIQRISPTILHDVMATLHGYSRRMAGQVCAAWRVAACDTLLPVEKADVHAWLEPRTAELMRALPQFVPPTHAVMHAWALTQHWLEGDD
jgi:hypothetical protein